MSNEPRRKPLGRKAYGSIGHLPCSRMGPGDHAVHAGQALICTTKTRDKHDRVIVQEKLDGSCCSVALLDGVLVPMSRSGWPAITSPYIQHIHFHNWVMLNSDRFFALLKEGERVVGEWLSQAHSTRYELKHEPFVAFDIMVGDKRLPFDTFRERTWNKFTIPYQLSDYQPRGVEEMLALAQQHNYHGAVEPVEGVVYRIERKGEVDFLAKYVRPDKKDGIYLPEISGQEPVWNWLPTSSSAPLSAPPAAAAGPESACTPEAPGDSSGPSSL